MKNIQTFLIGIAAVLVLVATGGVLSRTSVGTSSPTPARTLALATGGSPQAVYCSDLPISSQLISPDSCWRTGDFSMLIVGTEPSSSQTGVVAVIDGQAQQLAQVAGSGALKIIQANSAYGCLESASGSFFEVSLADAGISKAAQDSCAADTAAGAQVSPAATPQTSTQASASANAATGTGLPPPSSPSYYEYYGYMAECAGGATTGCPMYVQGQQTYTPSSGGLVVLDFGAPCSATSGSSLYYGVQMFDGPLNTSDPGASCIPDASIEALMQSWISGYESDHPAGTVPLAVAAGTSTSFSFADRNSGYQPASLTQSGADWYTNVVDAPYSQRTAAVEVWGGSDLEQSGSGEWYDGTDAVTWVQGYSAAAQSAGGQVGCSLTQAGSLADYGDYNQSYVETPGEPYPWTDSQVYQVSQGIPGTCAVPEIYYSGDAPEWQALSAKQDPAMPFTGVMAEQVSGTLSPTQAWDALESATGQTPAIPSLTDIGTALQGQPPQVKSVTPAQGSDIGGTTVTIQGADLLGASSVFFGANAATQFNVENATTISATAPPGSVGAATVTVETALGASASTASNSYLYLSTGVYHQLAPARIEDTRAGSGLPGAGQTVGPGQTLNVQVAGAGGVPSSGAVAVTVNLTETDPTAAGYLTAYPTGESVPYVSNLNFQPGQTRANLAVVALGANGEISIYNSAGTTDVVVDVEGWYDGSESTSGAGLFNPLPPQRIVDTRAASGYQAQGQTLGQGQSMTINVTGVGGVPTAGAEAVSVNVTETGATQASYLSVFPAGESRPTVSNLNFSAGQTIANQVVAQVGTGGQLTIYNFSGSVQVIVDVSGWFSDGVNASGGSDFVAMAPARLVDTRAGSGVAYQGQTMAPDGTLQTVLAGQAGVPASGVAALAMNVTVADPSAGGWLRVWEGNSPEPTTSVVNWSPGQVEENMALIGLGGGEVIFRNGSAGTVNVIVDVFGYYLQA